MFPVRSQDPASPVGSREELDATGDGYLRFHCPCGRRLKVASEGRPAAGKCPDCGRVIPVPESAWFAANPGSKAIPGDPEAQTEELDDNDLANLEKWADRHLAHNTRDDRPGLALNTPAPLLASTNPALDTDIITPSQSPTSGVRFEAGLRICPRCKKPIHLGAPTCRACGTPVPRQ